jgi:ribosomal protein L29
MQTVNKEVFIGAEDLRECTIEQLQEVIEETKQKLFELRRISAEMNRVDKPHLFAGYRRLIARAETILREKQCRLTS